MPRHLDWVVSLTNENGLPMCCLPEKMISGDKPQDLQSKVATFLTQVAWPVAPFRIKGLVDAS
jgi:hypothetical protein